MGITLLRHAGWGFALAVVLMVFCSGCNSPTSAEDGPTSGSETQKKERVEFADPGAVLYLDRGAPWEVSVCREEFYKLGSRGILTREFMRQALLIAAREELGLVVRDELLGDVMPSESNPARMTMGVVLGNGVRKLRISKADRTTGGSQSYSLGPNGLVNDRVYEQTEALSRGEFVRILKGFGFRGKPIPRNTAAKVPEEAERLLQKMSFPCQFAAIRLLHQTIREQGESDALLGALVRGYANLAWMSDYFWLPGKKAIQSRAVLYAQRLMASSENLRLARQHRAYALAACGLHTAALAELKSADDPNDSYEPIATDAAWETIRSLQQPPSFDGKPVWFSQKDRPKPTAEGLDHKPRKDDPPWVGCVAGLCHWNLDLLDSKRSIPRVKSWPTC